MAMAKETKSKTLSVSNEQYKETLLKTMDQLRKDDVLCDVRLVVEGQSFLAHRSILASSSPYFRGLFTNDMKEKEVMECSLDQLKSSVMEALLLLTWLNTICQ